MVDILDFVADKEAFTTAKRHLRQLTEFGFLEARSGNRSYKLNEKKTLILAL
ncbi:MAG: hypothetical protein J6X86_04570 [Bacteroidales bacterium]|nr:hypothetical protein [Bacteroidales bacterium]